MEALLRRITARTSRGHLSPSCPRCSQASKGKPDGMAMRTALRQWGFNTKRRGDCPDDAAVILNWLSRNTKPVAALADPATARAVLDAAGTLLDGQPRRHRPPCGRNRAILHNALEYAVELRLLSQQPRQGRSSGKHRRRHKKLTGAASSIHAQARRLLDAVRAANTQRPAAGRILRRHLLRGSPAGGSRQPPQGQHHPPAARTE